MEKVFSTRIIAFSAVMAALVCVATMLIQVPIPATKGFFNLGDAMVMVAGLTFGPIVGAIAGGLGSSLADFLGGWYTWVPFTLIIKGVEGFIVGYIMKYFGKNQGTYIYILSWFIGGLEMVSGYFLVQVAMYGFSAALVELPFNFVQMAMSGIIGVPIYLAIRNRLRL